MVLCSIPRSLRKVVNVFFSDSPMYSLPLSVRRNLSLFPDWRSTMASQRLNSFKSVLEALLGMR